MKTKVLLILCCVFFCAANNVLAQGEANIWYFGTNAGVDFNSGSPVVLTNGALSTLEGCASISTSSGALLFYTDGVTVWNNTHSPMPNGTGLLGDYSSTQAAIIVPKPGSTNIYYIFTTTQFGYPDGLRYSEVDMTLSGGLGDVTTTKNILLSTPVAEKLTVVKNANCVDYWVIAQDYSSNDFLVYSVTNSGVNTTPVISNTTTNSGLGGVGYLKPTADGSKLVSAISFFGSDSVAVFNFDKSTGTVTDDFQFYVPFEPYGVEFSPDGNRLYVSGWGWNTNNVQFGGILQYNMALTSATAIIASATVIDTIAIGENSNGSPQNAPDGKMYLPYGYYLSCINSPNALGVNCGYVANAVYLSGKSVPYGLPNYTQIVCPTTVSYVNTCLGDSTFFSLSDTSAIDSVHWSFDDPNSGIYNSSTAFYPYHIFTDTGVYSVSVITFSGLITDTIVVATEISSPPIYTLGNDTSLCQGTNITLDPGAGYTSYLWQNASINQTLNTSGPGTYFVTVTNYCGSKTDTINISQAVITVNVNNVTICAGQTASLMAVGADAYTWAAGILPNGTNTGSVTPLTTTTYSVVGTSGTCIDSTTFEVSVLPIPSVIAGDDIYTTLCNPVILNASGGIAYNWSPSEGLSCVQCPNPTASSSTTTDYCVTVEGNNGCVNSDCMRIFVSGDLIVPTAFSPNNDGYNDLFILRVVGSCFDSFSFLIFDRWGEKVFETQNISSTWDGTYRGKFLDPGVFVYSINATLFNGEIVSKKGNITLIR